MSNRISIFIKKKLLGKSNNLISLDDQYYVMQRFLKGHKITGIIDAGASNGRVSEKLLRKFPKANIYAFEPNTLWHEALQQYAEKDSRFHPYFAALSDSEGTAEFYVTKALGYSSLLAPGKRLCEIRPSGSTIRSCTKVDVVTIDQWAKRNGDIPIQLIKFDIQGGELKALRGAVNVLHTSVLMIYTEVWFIPAYDGGTFFGDIDLFLRQNSFELLDIFKPHYDPVGRFAWANAIYVHSKLLSGKSVG